MLGQGVAVIRMNLGKLERPHCSPSLEIMVNIGTDPQMALIQLSEIL